MRFGSVGRDKRSYHGKIAPHKGNREERREREAKMMSIVSESEDGDLFDCVGDDDDDEVDN